MNQQQKVVTNTTSASQGREVFGNWELSDKVVELDREELTAVAGGVDISVSGGFTLNTSSGDTAQESEADRKRREDEAFEEEQASQGDLRYI